MTEKQKYSKEYINNLAISLNKQYKNILPNEKVTRAYNMFKDSSKDIPQILEEIEKLKDNLIKEYLIRKQKQKEKFGYYGNMTQNNRESRTFAQVKDAYNVVKKYFDDNDLKVFICGGTVPYLLLNEDSNRLHDDIDTICSVDDINKLRQIFQKTPFYDKEWDSLSSSNNGKDYGFELKVNDVPIGIYPFSYENNKIIQYSYDPYNKGCKIKEIPIQNLSDYVTTYKSVDGKIYNTMSLEYIKLTKEATGRPKDLADVKKIDEIGTNQEVMDRIELYTNVHD